MPTTLSFSSFQLNVKPHRELLLTKGRSIREVGEGVGIFNLLGILSKFYVQQLFSVKSLT